MVTEGCQIKNGVAIRTGGKKKGLLGDGGNSIICDWDKPKEPSNPALEFNTGILP